MKPLESLENLYGVTDVGNPADAECRIFELINVRDFVPGAKVSLVICKDWEENLFKWVITWFHREDIEPESDVTLSLNNYEGEIHLKEIRKIEILKKAPDSENNVK